jgi:hypothetical protein
VKNLGIILSAFLAVSCIFVVSYDEVARAPSPTGEVDAIVIETNGGATTPFAYRVLVARRGAYWRLGTEVAFLVDARRSDQAAGVNLRWRSPNDLAIEYLQADDARLLEPEVSIRGVSVRTELASGVSDPAAPPGGMLYNLEGRPHDR